MSIDEETLRLILQAEAERRAGLELRGNELVGAVSDLEAVIAFAAQQLGCQLDPSRGPGELIRHGRLGVERLASFLATLDVEAEESPVEITGVGLPGDDDSGIDDEEGLFGDDNSLVDGAGLPGDDDSRFD